MLRPKAVTQSQVLTDGVDTVGTRVDYARETGEILYYDKLYYIRHRRLTYARETGGQEWGNCTRVHCS